MAKGKRAKGKPSQEQNQEVAAPTAETGDAVAANDAIDSVAGDDQEVAAVKAESAEAPKMSLEEAVRALISDPRDHWMGSIKVRAGLMGLNIHQFYPMERWKDVFIAWGGHGVLK